MKTALVITEGIRQVVLTPENDHEKKMLELLYSQEWELRVKRGQFFICRNDFARFGKWPREEGMYSHDDSAILVLHPVEKPKVA